MNGKRAPRSSGFTLIEVMVVVIILGILAATIIPQFVGTTLDAKIKKAQADIATLQQQLEVFNLHMERYPTNEEGLKALITRPTDGKNWRGPYIMQLRNDPWNNAYAYRAPGTRSASKAYDLWSRGADGQDGGEGPNADIGNWVEE